jgi:hypothetical protein
MARAPQAPTSIDFIVKAREHLYLEGSCRKIRRVQQGRCGQSPAIVWYLDQMPQVKYLYFHGVLIIYWCVGEPYPCQMQKTQTFSCLFRHYAKHNGLRKEGTGDGSSTVAAVL